MEPDDKKVLLWMLVRLCVFWALWVGLVLSFSLLLYLLK